MSQFQKLYGSEPAVQASAPGRVNLIGEHTDYNGGFVLPTAIPQRTHVFLAPRPDACVRAWSQAIDAAPRTYLLGDETPAHDWLDFVQGVTQLLGRAGHRFGGFDVVFESTVPPGSGVSSSAAFTVSLMRALRQAFQLQLDEIAIARLGQRVENEFVGARVGIMDPLAASLADAGTALFLDCRSLSFERLHLPAETGLIVIHSGVSHRLTGGDYNTRRGECEQACTLLEVAQLRECSLSDLPRIDALPEPLRRRARHVVTENDRVLQAVAAIRAGDAAALGKLFYDSHASMRDDYQVSVPEIDLLVELGRAEPGVSGARLTGGGFGGSVVMLASRDATAAAARHIATQYAERSGCEPRILVPAT